jgi:alanine racemase
MSTHNHSAWAEIDLSALVHNYRVLCPSSPRRNVIAVVKADAYGHGAVEVARALVKEKADLFAVATVAEGVELRNAGITQPILLMGAFLDADAEDILRYSLTASVSSLSFAEDLNKAARRLNAQAPVHIKVDTGMGRLGISEAMTITAIERMSVLANLVVEGIYTHFPSSDEEDKSFTLKQIADFNRIIRALENTGVAPKYHHCASSAACMDIPESHFDTVRPGLALYGLRPSTHCGRGLKLKPVMEFAARVVHVERRPAGASIGYGRTCKLEKDAVVAVISAGYADGYDRRLSGRGAVTIRGAQACVLGRISMDMISVDASCVPEVRVGDKAVLFSTDPSAPNSVEAIARAIDTIPYCLVCGVSKRVARLYKH